MPVASSVYFGQPNLVSFDPEQAKLAENLRRALSAMQGWPAARRLQYLVMLGVKNRKAEFTRAFGGDAMPEPDSVAGIWAADPAPRPLVKLLYVLTCGDDICLDAPTARSLTGEPSIANLIRVVKEAEGTHFVQRTVAVPRELVESDRDSMVGLKLTEEGRRYVTSVLHLESGSASAAR